MDFFSSQAESLSALFAPRSIAVVGASSNPQKIGGTISHQGQERGARLLDDPLRAEDDGGGARLDRLYDALLLVEPGLACLQLRFELLIEHDTSSSLTIPMGTTASPTEGIGTASADISGRTTETNGARSV